MPTDTIVPIDTFRQYLVRSDSLALSKLDSLTTAVAIIEKKITLSPWIPFLTAIAAGLLVLITQGIDRGCRKRQERRNIMIETFSLCSQLSITMKNLVKELAGMNNLRNFWHYSHSIEEHPTTGNAEISKKDYDTSLEYAKLATICKGKFAETLAAFFGASSKLRILSRANIDLLSILDLQTKIIFEDAKFIDASTSPEDADVQLKVNIADLSNSYLSYLSPIDAVINQLSLTIKSK